MKLKARLAESRGRKREGVALRAEAEGQKPVAIFAPSGQDNLRCRISQVGLSSANHEEQIST